MKSSTKYLLIFFLTVCVFTGCSTNKEVQSQSNIFTYNNSLIGDNSAVISIIKHLQHNKEFKEISLQTKEEPYGMTITYNEIKATEIEKEYKETAIYNATFLFALIENAEWVTFDFGGENYQYKITKEELQKWYGKLLSDFTNEEEIKNLVQKQLKDVNKINQLFR
ncbi:DUF4825 domain-containing protein [Gracilibacillus caseinilyticus]|uniref:DUF4825 domain-containing protein n=1 Tax=Gracilibacillus caseinilyticus TaxID=2932256 RepID=A0ABY4F176_9BACI|nr:DUF4825 domain-containing protein [Gracilibacillus caseinilyticus]UOQ49940.1 DUF4825 domain-containing protein [Gracilibacillus caseinilyticus]